MTEAVISTLSNYKKPIIIGGVAIGVVLGVIALSGFYFRFLSSQEVYGYLGGIGGALVLSLVLHLLLPPPPTKEVEPPIILPNIPKLDRVREGPKIYNKFVYRVIIGGESTPWIVMTGHGVPTVDFQKIFWFFKPNSHIDATTTQIEVAALSDPVSNMEKWELSSFASIGHTLQKEEGDKLVNENTITPINRPTGVTFSHDNRVEWSRFCELSLLEVVRTLVPQERDTSLSPTSSGEND